MTTTKTQTNNKTKNSPVAGTIRCGCQIDPQLPGLNFAQTGGNENKMKNSDYDKLQTITDGLSMNCVKDVEDFAADCEMLGAKKAAGYIRYAVNNGRRILKSLIVDALAMDAAGI